MRIPARNIADLLVQIRVGRVLGLLLFVGGLLQFRSYNRQVLGLWSYTFVLLIGVTAVVSIGVLLRLPRASFVDLALFCWGLAYCINAVDARENAENVSNFIFFGCSIITRGGQVVPTGDLPGAMAASALLQWLSLVFLFLGVAGRIIPRLDEKWSGLGMLLGTIFALALIGEGIARAKVAVAPAMEGLPTYSTVAWRRRYVKLNGEGYRDVEHSVSRDAARSRVLIIGDSFAFGWGIPRLEDRIGEQVAGRLTSRTGQQWEAINASRPGADTLDETGFLRDMIKYRPNLVVLIYIFNDIDYLIPQSNPAVLWNNRSVRFLWSNSYLFQGMFLRIRTIYYRFRHSVTAPTAVSGEMTDAEFAAYSNPVLMSQHLTDLANFAGIAQRAGAKVLVVPFDFSVMLQPRAIVRYENFMRQTQERGIPMCSMEHTWDGLAFRDLILNPADGHPNEKGDRLAAEAILSCLRANIAIGRSSGLQESTFVGVAAVR